MKNQIMRKHINKVVTVIITAIIMTVLGFESVAVMAQENIEGYYAYVDVVTELNLRAKPDTNSEVIARMEPKEVVSIISYDGKRWCEVMTEYGKGYVDKQYLDVITKEDFLELAAQARNVEQNKSNPENETLELLETVTVTKDHSSANRNFNMSRACEAIDGLRLEPGDYFNWYGRNGVGPADKAHGFKEATVLSGGKGVKGYGGGVCQVATALYNCIYSIGIDADTHSAHSVRQPYVKNGMVEATVAYGTKNFIFHNTKDYPIEFKAYAESCGKDGAGGQVIMSVYKVIKN